LVCAKGFDEQVVVGSSLTTKTLAPDRFQIPNKGINDMGKSFVTPPSLNLNLCQNMDINFGSWSTINLGSPGLGKLDTFMGILSSQRDVMLPLLIGRYGIKDCESKSISILKGDKLRMGFDQGSSS
jgi:hypothetical protein